MAFTRTQTATTYVAINFQLLVKNSMDVYILSLLDTSNSLRKVKSIK